jgi:putative spermidine/putrescine transport system permease protein
MTTVLCVLIGYPLAYVMANSSSTVRNVMLLMVMLPFMTSVLVRTYGWMVILRPTGLLNHIAELIGLPAFDLLYNRAGMLIGLVYTMVPYVVLTLFSVMRGIDGRLVSVAHSLGAGAWSAFWRVYFPLSLPGVAGASLLVFILSSGFYITPRLMGGDRDQLLASIIAYQVDVLLNFEFAATIAVILLVITLICFGIYARVVGLKQLLTSRA